ncbi:MAG: hypothetical protein ABSA12_09805 [Verrucomicrobiia bacterium]|jgi:hypothetical protein
MKARILKVSGLLVSLGSIAFGIYWVVQFGQSDSPDRSLLIAPLFFLGLPLTFIGNMVGGILLMAGKGLWFYALPIMICYFGQWQLVARWLYRKGDNVD